MTIMFAGGMTLAIPGFLPDSAIPIEAFADRGSTSGTLYVSSTEVQGAQVIQVIIDDPLLNVASTNGSVTIDVTPSGGSTETYNMFQMMDGTYHAYLVDDVTANAAHGVGTTSIGFGTDCAKTFLNPDTPGLDINTDTWAEASSCTNPDGSADNAVPMTALQNEPMEIRAGTTSLSGPLNIGNVATADAGTWPLIHAHDFADDNLIEYGSDAVTFTYGQKEAGVTFTSSDSDGIVVPGQKIQLTINDNGLNIDPTTVDAWTFLATSASEETDRSSVNTTDLNSSLAALGFGDNGTLTITEDTTISSDSMSVETTLADSFIFTETGLNTGVFTTHDVFGASDASISTTCTVDDKVSWLYADLTVTHVCATANASSTLDAGSEWSPSEAASYSVTDDDMNRNASYTETLDVQADNIIPFVKVGEPKFLLTSYMAGVTAGSSGISFTASDADAFDTVVNVADKTDDSGRVTLTLTSGTADTSTVMTINTGWDASTWGDASEPEEVLYYDICSIAEHLDTTAIAITLDGVATIEPGSNACSGEIQYSTAIGTGITGDSSVALVFTMTNPSVAGTAGDYVIAADLHAYGSTLGAAGIYRMEAVETGDNTGTFEGTVSYVQMNTVTNVAGFGPADYIVADGADLIIMLDNYATGTSGPRVNYGDTDVLGANNVTVGAQLDANTHSGVVSFDGTTYAVGDAATVTLVDADLNTDSTIVETYVGDGTYNTGVDMFTLMCDDLTCSTSVQLLLVEDGADSDTFIGVFTVPNDIGEDMEVIYKDSRDGTGTAVEWYATSTIGSTTGTISLDRQVYPVPFGISGVSSATGLKAGDATDLADWNGSSGNDTGTLTVWVYVSDPDYTDDQLKVSAGTTSEGTCSTINAGTTTNVFTFGAAEADSTATPKELGPMTETEQGSNVYEISGEIDETENSVLVVGGTTILQCKYVDANGDNGLETTVYDSSTFDLRNGSLTADKSVYIMGQDMVLTLTDDDLNLNSDSAETYVLNLIEWDSDADSSQLLSDTTTFTANPSALEETGDSTGVFQTVITIPSWINPNTSSGTALELGESITLTYRDAGRAGESRVAAQNTDDTTSEDVELAIAISNFGANITLDKTVYDWTDTVNIEVVAPDHNKNSNAKETIGTSALPVKVSTRSGAMCSGTYTLKESGEDTGIFEGYIVLTGHAQTINGNTTKAAIADVCSGPEGGKLATAGQDDGVTVTYEYNDGSVALASAIIQWNYSSIEFLESSVAADGSVTIRAVDPDEDLDDEVIDQVTIDVYSDSDSGGITKTLSETDEGTGIFEGTINFTSTAISSGDTLRVSEGDTVTAEITDYNLPGPDYTSSDNLLFAATTTVGTAFPPLERAPAANARVVDASGSSVAEVSVDQQVQIAADVTNGQGKDQAFAYLVQVQDASGVTVSLSWLTGSLTSGQSMTAAQSWTPTSSGTYTATVFVWESVSNPTALSPTVSVDIDVV
jgi:hypothetical protein